MPFSPYPKFSHSLPHKMGFVNTLFEFFFLIFVIFLILDKKAYIFCAFLQS